MRIKEIRVHRYGPLADFALTEPGDFTLLFGPNESGKTLLLDAILRFLLQRQREQALFWERDRVEHEPDGFVDILHGDEDLRFPDDGSLTDVLEIQADDLRNILVVRASDLHVQQGQQKEYYAALTDRLMGIHREPMRKIIDKLLDIGRLTATRRDLSDAAEYDSIASRFDKAQSLLEDIDALKAEFGAEDLIELETELIEAEEVREEVQRELALLEHAEKRERYQDGRGLIDDLEKCVAELDGLPDITQEDYDNWRDAEQEIERASEAIEEAQAELEQLGEALEQAKAAEKNARDYLRQVEAKETSVENLRGDARLYKDKLESDAGLSPLFEAAPRAVQLSAALFALAMIAVVLASGDGILPVIALIFALAFSFTGLLWLWGKRQEGKRDRDWEELRLEAAELGFQADAIEELLRAVREFSADLKRANENLNEATRGREEIEQAIETEEETIKESERRIEGAREVLEQLETDFDVTSLEYLGAMRSKVNELEGTRKELVTKLSERFGEATGSIEEKLEAWRGRIEELAEFENVAEGVEYDEARESELESQLRQLDSTIEETLHELADARGRISDIAQRANEVLRPQQSLPGDTLEDLNVLDRELKAFVDETNQQADLARRAIEILEGIQADEEQKVKELFGEDDLASQYFRSITGGAYQHVDYDPESGELRVVRPSEEILSAYKLSTGTYDQLYLATRLSLAERLLGGEPGFLLLDDPFLTSDSSRLERQLGILLELAEEGWQIVYFSVKEEVRAQLGEAIDTDRIREEIMPPLAEAV